MSSDGFDLSLFTQEQIAELATQILDRINHQMYPPLTHLELIVTEACNLACDYCFIRHSPTAMTWETAQKSIDFFLEKSREAEALHITFFGGEPLLEFDLIRRAVEYVRENAARRGKSVHFSITTNGTLLTDEIASFAPQNGFNYLLSIDGKPATHNRYRRFPNGNGSFEKVQEKIALLKRHQGWLGTRMTVRPDTATLLAENVSFLFELGINQFLIGVDGDTPWPREAELTFLEQFKQVGNFYRSMRREHKPIRIAAFESDLESLKKKNHHWGCGAGVTTIAVTPRGEIYPCSKFTGIPDHSGAQAYRLGNISTGFTEHALRRDLLEQRAHLRRKCVPCALHEVCAGGCPASKLSQQGNIYEPVPISCTYTKALLAVIKENGVLGENSPNTQAVTSTRCAQVELKKIPQLPSPSDNRTRPF